MTEDDENPIARIDEVSSEDVWDDSLSFETESGKDHVYFVLEMDGRKYIKIGKSKNPLKRLSALQSSNPRKLALVYHTTRLMETTLHARFYKDHKHGEWYHYSPKIKDFLKYLIIKEFNKRLKNIGLSEIDLKLCRTDSE